MKRKILLILPLLVCTLYLFSQPSFQHARLLPPDGEIGGYFGSGVDIYEDYAIVGSFLSDNGVIDSDKGSAYIYKLIDGNWTMIKKLVPSSQNTSTVFGISVSMYGDFAVVGATGEKGAKPTLDCRSLKLRYNYI